MEIAVIFFSGGNICVMGFFSRVEYAEVDLLTDACDAGFPSASIRINAL